MEEAMYEIHQQLESMFGPRRETGYLWAKLGEKVLVRRRDDPVPSCRNGEVYQARLSAMITKKRDGKRGWIRRDLKEPRIEWLHRRAEQHGFEAIDPVVSVERVFVDKPGAEFWADVSTFVFDLKVTDEVKLRQALTEGIGKGRTWGLGMLILGKGKVQ
jgi:hypothetical protein